MKKKIVLLVSLMLIFLFSIAGIGIVIRINGPTTVYISNTNDILLNPSKGFVYYGGSWDTTKSVMDYFTTGYNRFSWADLEPEEDKYDFSKIEKNLNFYTGINKKYSFGVMCVNTSSSKQYITPEYVFNDGAACDVIKDDNGNVIQYVPVWTDEIFLKHLTRFVTELGKRYNGNENIAFIDILSYGNWGEQHLFHLDVEGKPNYAYSDRISPSFFKERYVKPYMDAFPDTLLVNPWGYEDLNDVYEELIEQGVTLRRDGIVKYTNGLDMLAKCYGKLPTIFEYAGNYKDNIKDGTENYFNQRLEEAVNMAKPTYIELDIDWFKNNKDYCADLANRMGYYFRLKKAEYYKKVKLNKSTKINLTFKNDGIAPIYEQCLVYIGLLDKNGNLVAKFKTDIDAKKWLPNSPQKESVKIKFENISTGNYKLAVGLFKNDIDEAPSYLLGSEGKTENNWYLFGNVTINN